MLSLLLALLLGELPAPPSAAAVRHAATAFGRPVEIEIRDLPEEAARGILQRTVAEIEAVERLLDSSAPDGGPAKLSANAGKGPQPVDRRLLAVLARARDFCLWSEGAHGPLGRQLYTLWGLRTAVQGPPPPERAAQAATLAGCDRLTLDPQQGTATLAAGSGLDLWGFAEGHAVDRAVEVLRESGAGNGFVRIGPVQRAFGAGAAGKGWPVVLPIVAGSEGPARTLYLRDRSLAIVSPADHPLGGGAPYINQRTGQPAEGVLMVLAATDLAVDAQALAATLFITGPREGQLRMGSLRPRPSIRWLLGSGAGSPLQVDYRWSELNRR